MKNVLRSCTVAVFCSLAFLSSSALLVPAAHGANTFTATGSLGTGRYSHTATLLPNGKVLVAGGIDDNSTALASAEIYDPASGTWSPTGDLTIVRASHTATLLPNGKVLVAGYGAELYDPATGTWSPTGDLGTGRSGHTATLLLNGKVLVAGGGHAGAELYDPATGTWSATGALAHARSLHTATLLPNGKVLVVGGSYSEYFPAEIYDPAGNGGAGAWSTVGTNRVPRQEHTATLLPNGTVLIVGGWNSQGFTDSVEIYDSASGSWGGTASPRFVHATARLLPNGKVLVVEFGRAQLYDPATGTWSDGPFLFDSLWHTATLLPNGKVLFAGGVLHRRHRPRSALRFSQRLLECDRQPERIAFRSHRDAAAQWQGARRGRL